MVCWQISGMAQLQVEREHQHHPRVFTLDQQWQPIANRKIIYHFRFQGSAPFAQKHKVLMRQCLVEKHLSDIIFRWLCVWSKIFANTMFFIAQSSYDSMFCISSVMMKQHLVKKIFVRHNVLMALCLV